jgi:protein-tyrosine phosphatase
MDVHWIDRAFPGTLGLAPAPGGGDVLRGDLRELRAAGAIVLVSLLTPPEARSLGLQREGELAVDAGLDYVSFPIADCSVPRRRSGARSFLADTLVLLRQGDRVVVHCRAGVGRSGLVCAALLVLDGARPEDAWALVAQARGLPVPETAEQRLWVNALAHEP